MKSLQDRISEALNSVDAEIERAKIDFTEELLAQMEAKGISRTALAESLGVKPARITALLRGTNNFTLETMVRICRAIGTKYTHCIEPLEGTTVTNLQVTTAAIVWSDAIEKTMANWFEIGSPAMVSGSVTWLESGTAQQDNDDLFAEVKQSEPLTNRNRIESQAPDANLALAA